MVAQDTSDTSSSAAAEMSNEATEIDEIKISENTILDGERK